MFNLMYQLLKIGALTSKPYVFKARPWELEKIQYIDFFDPILPNIYFDLRGLTIMRVLPRLNDLLNEEWISDKIRFCYDGFFKQRILVPLLKNNNFYQEINWEEAFFSFFFKYNIIHFEYINYSKMFFYIGKFLDLYSLNSLKDNIDGFKDSFVKKQSFIKKTNFIFNNDIFNQFNINDFHKIDFCLSLNINLRQESPILFLKFLKEINHNGLLFFNFGKINYQKNYNIGNNINKLISFLSMKSKISNLIIKAKNPVYLISNKSFNNFLFFNLRKLDNLLFFLKKNFSKININNNLSETNLYLIGHSQYKYYTQKINNNIYFFYNYENLLFNNNLNLSNNYLIYQGTHGGKISSLANLILPSTLILERKGDIYNLYGNLINLPYIIKPNKQVRTDWRIFKSMSLYFSNYNFFNNKNYFNFKDIYKRINFFLPLVKKIIFIEFNFNKITGNDSLLFKNSYYFSFYINNFLSDGISKSSKYMGIASVRFNKYFYNFKK